MEKLWLKEYDAGVSYEIYDKIPSLPELLQSISTKYPEKSAIKANGASITYKNLNRMTAVISGNLRLLGLNHGDKVCVFLPNSKETILAFWAITRGGFIGVMTNPLYSEDELVHQINDSGSKIIITSSVLLEKVMNSIERTKIQNVVVVQNECNTEPNDPRILAWNELLKENRGYTENNINVDNDIALLQYTGGTTGISKGCMLTHKNLVVNAMAIKQFFSPILREGEEKFLGVLPFFHIYGLQFCVVACALLGSESIPIMRFSPKAMLTSIQSDKITAIPCSPSIFSACLNQKDLDTYNFSSLKVLMSGSAPLPLAQKQAFEKRTGAVITEGYGLSESSPVTHFTPLKSKKTKLCSIGVPFPGTDAKIVDVEYGIKELGVNEDGELCIKGPQVMKGYYNQEGQTEMVLKDGWLHTGDIAHYDEDGYFYITDRKKDLIISGGYNVYPREIEEVLFKLKKVKEVAVIGIADELRGEIAKAIIVLKDGETATKQEIIAFCREHLANYKVPKQVEFRTSIPKTAVGKIQKEALRKEAAKQQKAEN